MKDISNELLERSGGVCELCGTNTDLSTYTVPPKTSDNPDHEVALCDICFQGMGSEDDLSDNHWRCVTESIWSTVPAIQVVSYRMLQKFDAAWSTDTLSMIDLDPKLREWAEDDHITYDAVHKDSNGNVLKTGDSVVLIQDVPVKGANFTAKRGTPVRRITLVQGNPEQIEGKVNDQHIVILTKYVKKSQ